MEAHDIAKGIQESVNMLRRRKGLPKTMPWKPLYARALKKCTQACDNNMRTMTQVVKHGFRETVSRVIFNPEDMTVSTRNQLLAGWVKYRPNVWNLFSTHLFSAIAVFIQGNEAFITYTLTASMNHPCMRETNPAPILKLPPITEGPISPKDDGEIISESALLHLNIGLMPYRCVLKFDAHLKRLADYYCRESKDFGVMQLGNSEMAGTVFQVDIRGVGIGEVGEVVAREILARLSVEVECRKCYGGIGITGDTEMLWVCIVCYGRRFHEK